MLFRSYEILLPLLVILTIVAWLAEIPRSIPLGTFAIIILVASAYFLNRWIKISLHTGFGVFVGLTLFLILPIFGIVATILALLVAWSRVVLRRHTTREVVFGGALGIVVGGIFLVVVRLFF